MALKVKEINPAVANFDQLPDNSYMRPNATAELLGISIATFWRLVKSGQLKTHKFTQRTTTVKVSDLRAFMAKGA